MSAVVDTSGLSKAINERLRYPGRTEAEAMNMAALNVAVKAMRGISKVDVGRIDTELKVSVNPKITKTGKVRRVKSFGTVKIQGQEVPLIAVIIQSRANPASRYNELTKGQFAGESPFKGKSKSAGASAMRQAVRKLLAARHKSIAFLKSGWVPAIKTLLSVASKKSSPPEMNANLGHVERGAATVATEGSWNVEASIENATGLEGVNAEKVNEALLVHGTVPLQSAIDSETQATLDYIARKNAEKDARMNRMMS